jgi:hypothetical protein
MKPILLIILVVASCHRSTERNEYNAKKIEPYVIEVSSTPDSIYTVTGRLNGSIHYERISTYASDTSLMIDEAKGYIFATMDEERRNYSEILNSHSVYDLFRD